MKVIDTKTGFPIGKNIWAATSFWPRLIGFMFRKSPAPFDGIFFPGCKWVHNSFVRFPIDVVFIANDGKIIKIIRNFKPWQVSGVYFTARHTIEFAEGVLPKTISVGDQLIIEL